MKSFDYTIQDPVGMHARPAGRLAREAAATHSAVTVVKGEKKADTRRLMALMGLGIRQGDAIRVEVEGPDEEQAAAALKRFLAENNF